MTSAAEHIPIVMAKFRVLALARPFTRVSNVWYVQHLQNETVVVRAGIASLSNVCRRPYTAFLRP
jgi:hypothetical protein